MALSRICFFGASTTEGLGDETRLGWPGRLLKDTAPNRADIIAYNLGVRGQTSSMMKTRFTGECKARLTEDAQNIIFISFGLNDVAEVGGIPRMPRHRTLSNVAEIMDSAEELADQVLWMGPAPVHDGMMPITYANGNVFSFSNDVVSALNDEYRDIASTYDIPYLDVFNDLISGGAYEDALTNCDGLHPTGEGYQLVTDRISAWTPWQQIVS